MSSSNTMRLSGVVVAYVSTGGFSGATRTLKQARTLAKTGAQVFFVGYDGLVPELLVDSGVPVVAVPRPTPWCSRSRVWLVRVALNLTIGRAHSVWWKHRTRRVLVNAVSRTHANVVQAVDLPALECAYEASRRLRARLVYDSHELWSGFLQNPDLRAEPAWARELLLAEKRLVPAADRVIVVSDSMGERLRSRYRIVPPLTVLNAPPQRVDAVAPVSCPVRLVFHGGLSVDRNIDGLIRAMVYLRGRATLDIHGSSRTVDTHVLEELITELDLNEVVRLRGSFEYDQVMDLIRDYDIGVMAARVLEENFEIALPNKLFDCMCAGLAVAMTDTPAIRGVLDDVPFGITLDPSTPETIARDLGALIDDPDRIMAMKQAAVEASARYWWPEQGRKLVAALEEMLASR